MISNDRIASLEKNIKLKKKIFGEGLYRNYAIYPPSLIIFVGILGVIYLLDVDLLLSLYTIPFVLIFLLGTIWLKFTKRFIINKKIEDTTVFLICLPVLLKTIKGKDLILFSINRNRNNSNYLEREKKDLLASDDINTLLSDVGFKPKQINNSDLFLAKKAIQKKTLDNSKLVYTGDDNSVQFISERDLKKY